MLLTMQGSKDIFAHELFHSYDKTWNKISLIMSFEVTICAKDIQFYLLLNALT